MIVSNVRYAPSPVSVKSSPLPDRSPVCPPLLVLPVVPATSCVWLWRAPGAFALLFPVVPPPPGGGGWGGPGGGFALFSPVPPPRDGNGVGGSPATPFPAPSVVDVSENVWLCSIP